MGRTNIHRVGRWLDGTEDTTEANVTHTSGCVHRKCDVILSSTCCKKSLKVLILQSHRRYVVWNGFRNTICLFVFVKASCFISIHQIYQPTLRQIADDVINTRSKLVELTVTCDAVNKHFIWLIGEPGASRFSCYRNCHQVDAILSQFSCTIANLSLVLVQTAIRDHNHQAESVRITLWVDIISNCLQSSGCVGLRFSNTEVIDSSGDVIAISAQPQACLWVSAVADNCNSQGVRSNFIIIKKIRYEWSSPLQTVLANIWWNIDYNGNVQPSTYASCKGKNETFERVWMTILLITCS